MVANVIKMEISWVWNLLLWYSQRFFWLVQLH